MHRYTGKKTTEFVTLRTSQFAENNHIAFRAATSKVLIDGEAKHPFISIGKWKQNDIFQAYIPTKQHLTISPAAWKNFVKGVIEFDKQIDSELGNLETQYNLGM